MYYHPSCTILFALVATVLLAHLVSAQVPPAYATWDLQTQQEYNKSVTIHNSLWTQQRSANSSLQYVQLLVNKNANSFAFGETFKNVSTFNFRIIRYVEGNAEVIETVKDIPANFSVTPNKPSNTAVSECKNNVTGSSSAKNASRLCIVHFDTRPVLVWIVDLTISAVNQWTCYVTANSSSGNYLKTVGQTVFAFKSSRNAFGDTLYNGNQYIENNLYGGNYYLEDSTTQQAVFNCTSANCATASRVSNPTTLWGANAQAAVSVAWAVSKTHEYFQAAHGRYGMDGAYGPSTTTSADGLTPMFGHYVNNDNADSVWTVNGTYYGAGNNATGTGSSGPVVSLDIAAHEWSHGILHYAIPGGNGMVYFDESGALEESFCDIFGIMVEQYVLGESDATWRIGENYFHNGTWDAVRYLNYPKMAPNKGYTPDDDPDHYFDKYNGTLDNGGVHVNSGIPNKAFYLLSKGGNHTYTNVTMTGIGISDSAKIWYRAFTVFVTPVMDFLSARDATVRACKDLFGTTSAKCFSVQVAWGMVGVGDIPVPVPTQVIVNPTMERVQSPFVITGTGVTYYSAGTQGYAGSRGYFMLGTVNGAAGTVYQGPLTLPNNTNSALLSFRLRIDTTETSLSPVDKLDVQLRDPTTNAVITTFATEVVLSSALEYSSRPPVSVCGTVSYD
eukprot:TRINITY_DN8673_c0_g1_i1.p1 TRINITY_DN8673_c0_g1~~TRINITY_DN8673_c0_g1_i1.p1  ORF type:complete len:672 (+),score=170.69 TRINITY_DN8673_c0_g1_i1:515-2530(+)